MIRQIHAELIKLKYLPIFWLCFAILLCIAAIVFAAHFIDIHSAAELGKNPWKKVFNAAAGIFTVFMSIPFVVLMTSASFYIENGANGWKQLYTMPASRSKSLLSKLVAILVSIIICLLVLSIVIIVVGFALEFFLPEMEFKYYPINIMLFIKIMGHTFLSLLGIIGIQFFLCSRTRGFLVPASFGILAFIVGFIIGTTNKALAKFSPYSYPSISQDFNMFKVDKIGVEQIGPISNLEWYSIGIFAVMIIFTLISESRRNIR